MFVSEVTNTACVLPIWADGNPSAKMVNAFVSIDPDCVKVDLLPGKFYTVNCDYINPVICEKSLNSGNHGI